MGRLLVDEPALLEQGAYLRPDHTTIAKWRQRLATLGPRRNIGIAWQSRSGEPAAGRPLSEWINLLEVPGVNWVNLQPSEADAALAECVARTGIEIHDWEDADALCDVGTLAAQMSALDLVICPDGFTAQLAAASGASVWVLLSDQQNWRWGYQHESICDRGTLRLFQPDVPNEGRDCFADLISRAADELQRDVSEFTIGGEDSSVPVDIEPTVRAESMPLRKCHPTINDSRSQLTGASVDEAIALATRLHEDKEDLELAEHICRVVLDEVPHRVKAMHRLGALLITLERADEAVPLLEHAVALRPSAPLNHYQLAAAFTELNRHDDAIEPLRRAIALKPNFAEAYINLGAVLERCGNWRMPNRCVDAPWT